MQNFYPSPLANATTMYYTEKTPQQGEPPGRGRVRGERGASPSPHKALLRYHDPAGWPMIREALLEMGKGHLIGNAPTAWCRRKVAEKPKPSAAAARASKPR